MSLEDNNTNLQQEGRKFLKKVKCCFCDSSFEYEHRVKIHMQFNCKIAYSVGGSPRKSDYPRPCLGCRRQFRTVRGLRTHIIRDCGVEKNIHCQICDFVTSWKYLYQKHMHKEHPRIMEAIAQTVQINTQNKENQPRPMQIITENQMISSSKSYNLRSFKRTSTKNIKCNSKLTKIKKKNGGKNKFVTKIKANKDQKNHMEDNKENKHGENHEPDKAPVCAGDTSVCILMEDEDKMAVENLIGTMNQSLDTVLEELP